MKQIRLHADYESARAIGPWLEEALTELGSLQLDRVGELELAIHEVAINIVDHAFNGAEGHDYTITLRAAECGTGVVATFHDSGDPFVSAPTPSPTEPQVGGYGLFIAEQLASSVNYERLDHANRWTLIFTSSPDQPTAQDPS